MVLFQSAPRRTVACKRRGTEMQLQESARMKIRRAVPKPLTDFIGAMIETDEVEEPEETTTMASSR